MIIVRLLLTLGILLAPLSASADTMAFFSFGVSGQDYGTGYISHKGNYVHNGSMVNTASLAKDGVVGRMAGFSDFSIYDAIGTSIQAGNSYDVLEDFSFLYFDDLRLYNILPDDPYFDYRRNIGYSAPLTLSSISFSGDGKNMTLSGSLANWITSSDAFDSEVMNLITSNDPAEFTLVIAADTSIVDFLNSKKGGKLSTWVESGTVSVGGGASTPEPSTLLLVGSLMPLGWALRRRLGL
ncbi:MAG: PEP-CTERM sorting domain-containing protein [Desulfarculaceae bacterium]|nr:PEP-CTERM sorting domain-containing protein [Desulfarculaceae bacterium]MCF8070877.1 PEP-CTERM sorting domain-containing protein [Desulfarculaceae bacterium]MCF8100465.1 PEP-CTERM sorting domain-containing protein [Desulfarculaceae bacterium]MCF8117949.1 PEP-CTERM sorting domain-containing protein [Desulfarculaceae bacterium]